MKVALIGNQNSGKSTLFNTLTGSNQKIGNWPGVTIEKKTGVIKGTSFELVDLPGIYSLNPYTKEEGVTSHFILEEDFDVLINIIDCNSIQRGLYLTTQLLDLKKNLVVALNMYDIAEKKGINIDERKLSGLLGNIPVIKISAVNGNGCDALIANLKEISITNRRIARQEQISDKEIKKQYEKKVELENKIVNTEKEIEERYHVIDKILGDAIVYTKKRKATLTDILDKIFLNKYLAIPIFAIFMFIIYFFSIEIVGNSTIDIINNWFEITSQELEIWLNNSGAKPALNSLLTDGIINGVSAVISFLPQLAFLFIAISFLEKVGYMARISLIFDKIFRKLGISGNSVISFIIGTGCSVSGIMATRTIKNEREKEITAILTPFIPCSAKLPIISLFATYFFREKSGFVAVSFYLLAIVLIILSSILFKRINKSLYKVSYVSELPEFRFPRISQILKDSLERVWDFVKRAGSIILVSSIVVWLLLSYSIRLEYGVEIQDSILADIGRTFSWIFIPMVGENSWEIAVSSIQGLIAKEQVISSMSIIAGLEAKNVSNSIFASGSPFAFFTPASAYAYVCFNLFSAPCFGAISAMRKALGGTKNMLKAIGYQIGLAYVLSCAIYFIGR